MSMIEAKNLEKSFGKIKAVDDLSLSVDKGEIVGVLGVNGAGKTTFIRLITGYLKPDKGTVKCQTFGYMPEGAPVYPELTVETFLKFVAEVHGKKKIDEAVKLAKLESVLTQKIETLSKGFKRRVALAAALIHNPPVLLLDEPTEGLDPNQKEDLRKILKELSKTKAILISTHILEEVRSLCTSAILINKGKMVKKLAPKDFKNLETLFKGLKDEKK